MSTPKPLPARPSLESLRKQAKKLARDTASGDADAIARVQLHAPKVHLPLTQRNAQLVVAREYGYDGWQELTAEVSKRLGTALEWATSQARRAIHDDDVERLTQLLADHPALLDGERGWVDFNHRAGVAVIALANDVCAAIGAMDARATTAATMAARSFMANLSRHTLAALSGLNQRGICQTIRDPCTNTT